MNAKHALIAGAATLGVAAVAGLGWKCLSKRNKKSEAVEPAVVTPVVPPVVKKEEKVVEATPADLRATGNVVLAAVADLAESHQDKVEVITPPSGKPILSISRPRVVTPDEGPMSPDMTPSFWKNFINNIKRPEIIELTSGEFDKHNGAHAKGFHRCTIDGIAGVLHVTKSHTTAMIHLGGDEFSGISTSASRFNGKGLVNLTSAQAKNFLAGR
ncbi:hypothetical protein D3C76_25590 [compost metagenome]